MNPYDILNVRRNASNNEIKFSFNRLMEKYDLKNYPGDPYFAKKRMKEIAEAYNILSDSQKRKAYDATHEVHVNLHQKESINNDDVFKPYYNIPKTTSHIHNDYEIAQEKYNNSQNYNYDDWDSLDEIYEFEKNDDPISGGINNLSPEERKKAMEQLLPLVIFCAFLLFYVINVFVSIYKSL